VESCSFLMRRRSSVF